MRFSRSRREMMLKTARAVAGLTLAGGCQRLSQQSYECKGSGGGFKIGVCDWTVGMMAKPSVLEMAKQLGADGAQVDFGTVDDYLPVLHQPEIQKEYLESARKHSVEVASFGMIALGWERYKSDPQGVKWVEESIEVCKAMDVSVVLVPFFGADLTGDKEGTEIVIRQLKAVAPKAEEAGVVFGLESRLNAEQNMYIIDNVGSPAVQVYYDVGNLHKKGDDIYKEIRFLGAEHICQFHAKDYGDEIFGKGDIDFERVREAMDDIGYRGWVVFESTSWTPATPVSPRTEEIFRRNIDYLRRIFPPTV